MLSSNLQSINTIFNWLPWIVNFAVLLFFLWQINIRPRKELPQQMLLWGIVVLAGFIFLHALAKTGLQYWTWKNGGPLAQAFLPPTTSITYFLGYVGWRFWLPVTTNISLGTLFGTAIYLIQVPKIKSKFGFVALSGFVASAIVFTIGPWMSSIFDFYGLIFAIIIIIICASAVYFLRKITERSRGRFFYEGEEYIAMITTIVVGWPIIIIYLPLIFLFMIASSLLNTFTQKIKYTSFLYAWLPLALVSLLFGKWAIIKLGLGALFIAGS